jgi:hypothetical protein
VCAGRNTVRAGWNTVRAGWNTVRAGWNTMRPCGTQCGPAGTQCGPAATQGRRRARRRLAREFAPQAGADAHPGRGQCPASAYLFTVRSDGRPVWGHEAFA